MGQLFSVLVPICSLFSWVLRRFSKGLIVLHEKHAKRTEAAVMAGGWVDHPIPFCTGLHRPAQIWHRNMGRRITISAGKYRSRQAAEQDGRPYFMQPLYFLLRCFV